MIHWERLRLPVWAIFIGTLALGAAGCPARNDTQPPQSVVAPPQPSGSGSSTPAPETTPEPTPPPAPKPAENVGALAQGIDLTLADNKTGAIVARIKASTGAVGMTGPDKGAAGALSNGVATLYDKGKATATVTADKIFADQASRTITGKGHVVARSLIHEGAPTVKADTMVWNHDEGTIRGNGNVVMTQQPSVYLRGERFVANTELRRVEVFAE